MYLLQTEFCVRGNNELASSALSNMLSGKYAQWQAGSSTGQYPSFYKKERHVTLFTSHLGK
jgi:hypothetical protein